MTVASVEIPVARPSSSRRSAPPRPLFEPVAAPRSREPRHELRYVISSEVRNALLPQLSAWMRPDPHGTAGAGLYRIHSLYLDSPEMAIYWEKVDGLLYRNKIRIRYYGDLRGPVNLEVKERLDARILKSQFRLDPETLQLALRGRPLPDDRHNRAVQLYNRYVRHYGIRPRAHIAYLRQAFVSPLPGDLRLTFDTHVTASLCRPACAGTFGAYQVLHPQWTIFEIKFTALMPEWVNGLVRRNSLSNEAFCKYYAGIKQLLKLGLVEAADA